MDWMYLFYFLLALLMAFGAQYAGRGAWNEEYTSLRQTKMLQGITALGIALHHMAQKTCAPWHPQKYTVHGLEPFLSVGYLLVGVFLFCSGMGLYKSFKTKPDYLKGFFRRRVLPLVIAYYLSEWIYTAIRYAMNEVMDLKTVLWYLSGLHMANFNSWYMVAIVLFYAVFRAAFRLCKKEGAAICLVFLAALGYTALGVLIGHQDDWWMRGEWWYNSIMLFPLGLLFGKFEERVTAFFKKGYLFWLLLFCAAVALLLPQSEWLNNNAWGYYGEVGDPMTIPHCLMSVGLQWLTASAYVTLCFLLLMKIRFGNRVLGWLGSVTLEFYLAHGIFVELFGYNFLDIAKSLVYIRSVPLFIAAVLGCSVPATLLFSFLWKLILRLLPGTPRRERPARRRLPRWFIPGAVAVLGVALMPLLSGDKNVRVMSGMTFHVPEQFTRTYSERRYAVWEDKGAGKRAGKLVLDADIRDGKARNLHTAEEVLASCDWLTGAELYVNPQGVRMVRGFADYAGNRERRYYIETTGPVLLMCMIEDERYYDRDACEAALLQVAEGVVRAN